MSIIPHLTVHSGKKATASVIWLHGLGANGHDFEPIVPDLKLPNQDEIRFIFPHAPEIPVTINGGMIMPAWYDIQDISIDRVIDTEQLRRSASAILALVEQEEALGIPSERVVLAGFSQGGAVTYELALSYPKKFAGLLVMSSYFATYDSITLAPNNRDLPIQVFHGEHDPIVPEILGHLAIQRLQELGYAPTYQTYPMDHSVCWEEIQATSAWLQKVLP